MTGFGESKCTIGLHSLNVKIISLNSRYLEINFNIPPSFDSMRPLLEKEIKKFFARGKITIKVDIEEEEREYIEKIHNFIHNANQYFIKNPITSENLPFNLIFDLGKLHIIKHKQVNIFNTYEKRQFNRCFKDALQRVLKMRKVEGQKTEKYLRERLNIIQRTLQEIIKLKKAERNEAEQKYRNKGIEEGDTLSSLLLKLDVSEEIERLHSHIKYFRHVLREKGQEKGKKLDFLSQEIMRELSTLASKTHRTDIVHKVILLKEEIEKIREQLRNIQ